MVGTPGWRYAWAMKAEWRLGGWNNKWRLIPSSSDLLEGMPAMMKESEQVVPVTPVRSPESPGKLGQADTVCLQTTRHLWFRCSHEIRQNGQEMVFQKHREKGTLADTCQGETGLGSFTCPVANHRASQKNGHFWTFLIKTKSYRVGVNVSSSAPEVSFAWLCSALLTLSSELWVNKRESSSALWSHHSTHHYRHCKWAPRNKRSEEAGSSWQKEYLEIAAGTLKSKCS